MPSSTQARTEVSQVFGLRAPWALVDSVVWTGDGQVVEAIAFGRDGGIAALGSTERVLAHAVRDRAEVVDGAGTFVCPGFVDPHVHVRASASAEMGIDVSGARGRGELLAAVAGACGISPEATWVTLGGNGLGSPLTGAAPDRREIDGVSGSCAVRIRDRSGHGWLFNSAGLRALGVELTTTANSAAHAGGIPPGVAIERDADFTATGFVIDDVGWVGLRLGRITDEGQMRLAVERWSARQARLGVVALCDATATNGASQVRSLGRWREQRTLRQECTCLSAPDAEIDLADRWRMAGVKFADAADRRLRGALRDADHGPQVAVHCVSPEQTAAALAAAEDCGHRRRASLRLEHASFVPPDWTGSVRRLGVTVVTHPGFIAAHGDRYRADPELSPREWLYRLGSWDRAGVPVAFASDGPFGPADPLLSMRAAADRRTASGAQIGPEEALTGERALRAMTVTAAACSGLDRLGYGRLARGGPGAAVLLDRDPRQPRGLRDLRLLATVIDGDVVC